MLESALAQTNFVGRDGFIWWIGRVADPEHWRDQSTDVKSGWAFRCKVRIIGYHPFDESIMGEKDLPWAHVMVDPTSGAGQACLGEKSKMVGGETVFGFFLDGEEAQQPVIFGALARSINDKSGPSNFLRDGAESEANAFAVATGRKAGIDGMTTLPNSENKELNPAAVAEGKNQLQENAKNKAGEEKKNSPGELESGKEGISNDRKSEVEFSNTQLGPHSMDNGCEQGPLGDIAHTIGSFLTTVNSLTAYAGAYIDTAQNLLADVNKLVRKASKLISAAVKKILNVIRDKVIGLITKVFRNVQALIIPEPQKSPILKALQKILDILFCIFGDQLPGLFDLVTGLLKDMIGKVLNPSVCAVEQMVGNILGEIYDKLTKALKPILDGLDWLTGALGSVGSLLSKVSSYVNMLLGFFACAKLSCKEYDDWSQGLGITSKPDLSFGKVLDNMKILEQYDNFVGAADTTGDGVYDARAKFSLLSMLGGGLPDFFDCNARVQNPQTQDDLGNSVPPGFTWSECIPPKIEVRGDGTKTAVLMPIVSSVNGSILTLEILEPGLNYTGTPRIAIIDKTRHGGGAHAEAIIDENGSIVDIFMLAPGEGYCPSTNVVPPKYPVTEDDDDENPFITFTTPADDAVGVQTSTSLSITFNEPIVKGNGDVTITESGTNVVHERINVKNNKISFLSDRIIKIDPKNDLKFNTEYYISMSEGSFLDLYENQFAGMGRTDTYNFTTRGVSGIGSEAVGIVTDLVPYRPGIGYTSGDKGRVGDCSFDLIVTPAGSIAGINNINCQDKHKSIPSVSIDTRTGIGARLYPIMSYSPDYVSDIGEKPSRDGGIIGRGGIVSTDEARRGGTLFVKVVDCVYSQRTTQVGWVNGNPYYGDFHVHPSTGKKMVGPTHVSSPHATIYNTKNESLGQQPVIIYTPQSSTTTTTTTTPTVSTTNTTTTTEQTNASADTTDSSTPSINTNTPQETTQPQEQTGGTTPPSTPPPSSPPSGGGGSGGSGGSGGYGGGY
mgnify:CR=1 FL=1|jgi:hypothetical protein